LPDAGYGTKYEDDAEKGSSTAQVHGSSPIIRLTRAGR
jgi:hypothetical protein